MILPKIGQRWLWDCDLGFEHSGFIAEIIDDSNMKILQFTAPARNPTYFIGGIRN